MKKYSIIALLLALCLALTSCAGTPAPAPTAAPTEAPNTAPSISGAADQAVMAGTEFDALAGIVATDAEDGDITGMVNVEASPALTFKNGKTTPETAGSYELVYSVTDKGGLTAEAYATLTVTKKTADEVVYKAFDFSTQEVTDNHGWEARINEPAQATASLKEGAYVIEIANPGEGDGNIQLAKPGYAVKPADYKVKMWVKSSKPTFAHFLARDEQADGWALLGDVWNARIIEEIAPIELNFTASQEGSVELLFNLGKITPNPDNAEDTTPTDFVVTIDKIELYEISGEEHLVPVYTADFASEGVAVEAGDGANATTAFDGTAKVEIANYPTEGGVWSVKANILLGDVTIENGQKYSYSFTLNAANGQGGECLVESNAQYDQCRVHFNGFSAAAGEDVVISGTFTADKDIADPVIRLQIGNAPEGVTANTLTISNVVFNKVEGDKETHKTIENFIAFGRNTANGQNPDRAWETFNGTDEDNDRGVGTIWAQDGKFFYRIDNGGTVDWHNKLIYGYTGNPLILASDSYYTVEITAKATKDVACGVFLNPMGGWDPRVAERMELTTEPQTFRFTTTDTFVMDMDFELLFQFGSEATANAGEVTVEFDNVTIYQMLVQ